jgi:hypothetical protein
MGCTACTEPQCLYKVDLYLYLFTHALLLQFLFPVIYKIIRLFHKIIEKPQLFRVFQKVLYNFESV